jgi:hypothetical protein
MTKRRYLRGAPIALAAAVLAIILAGCTEKEKPASAPPPPSETVLVIFEGPWGFVPDPGDPTNSIIAIAPATDDHHELYVKASYSEPLKVGRYDLAMPPRTITPSGTIIPDIFQTPVDAKAVNNVLNNVISDPKLHRYTVHLPKPENYTPYTREVSSIGPAPHPAANGIVAKAWATAVSLQYTVGSLTTFKVSGTPDTGTFPDYPLQLDTHQISFVITPLHDDDPHDLCYTHDREAFHNLTTLLGVTLFVDFQGSPSTCPAAEIPGHTMDVQEAGAIPMGWLTSLTRSAFGRLGRRSAAFYLFAQPTTDCKSPNIIGSLGG